MTYFRAGEVGSVYDWPSLLKELRVSQGWRQRDLSARLKIGSNVTVSRWERGETTPDTHYSHALENLCRRYGLHMLLHRYRVGTVRLHLPWFHHAQFAGFYAASLAGLYKEAALHVALDEGGFTPESSPLETVSNGTSDFGVCRPWSLLKAVAETPSKYRVKIVAVLFERTPLCQIILPRNQGKRLSQPITTFEQVLPIILDGRAQVGRPEPSNRANLELRVALHHVARRLKGIDVAGTDASLHLQQHHLGGEVFADVIGAAHRVQARSHLHTKSRLQAKSHPRDEGRFIKTIPAYAFNEPHILARAGLRHGRDFSVISHHEELEKLGLPSCGDVLLTSQRLIEQQPEIVRRFCQASIQGWELVQREIDRDSARPLGWVQAFMSQTFRPFDREHQKDMLRSICQHYLGQDLLSRTNKPERSEAGGKRRWQSMIVALEESGLIRRDALTPEAFVWAELLDCTSTNKHK